MLLFSAPRAQLQGDSLCPPQLCLVGIPGVGWGGSIHTLLKFWAVLLGALLCLEGQRRPLKSRGNLAQGLRFPGERVFSTEGRSCTKAGRKYRVCVCEESGRFREAEQAWCGWRLWADVGNQ